MEPPRTDGVGGVGCPPLHEGRGWQCVPPPLFTVQKRNSGCPGGGPEEPSVSGPWEGRWGLRGGLSGAALHLAVAGGAAGGALRALCGIQLLVPSVVGEGFPAARGAVGRKKG